MITQRRTLLAAAATLTACTLWQGSMAAHAQLDMSQFAERASSANAPDLTITQQVYLDIGMCPEAFRADRALGDKSALCNNPEPLGRLVLGLYGNHVPNTVASFTELVRSGAYTGTTFSKILPGEYVMAGKQGAKRMGAVELSRMLDANPEVLSGAAFSLPHARPGTLSLAVSVSDDDELVKDRRGYRTVEFLITTGPGPVPSLDGQNIVFGRVMDGMSTVAAMTTIPTIQPNERVKAMNTLAAFIGDERASKARQKWGSPLKAVVITDAGVL